MDIRQLEAADAPVYRAFRLRDTQTTARYERAGFVSFGVEPDAIRVGGIRLGACRTWGSSAANRPQRSIFHRLFDP